MLVAESRQAAEQAVLPEAPATALLLILVEAQERRDPAPMAEIGVLAQVLVARFEAIGPTVLPALHVPQSARRRVLHLEDVLIVLRRKRLERALVGDVVIAGDRLMQPALGRLPVIVHGRDQHVAR